EFHERHVRVGHRIDQGREVRARRHAGRLERDHDQRHGVHDDSEHVAGRARGDGARLHRPHPRLPVGRQAVGEGVVMAFSSEKGFSLAETVIALGVLTTGIIGAASVLVAGMTNLSSSPADVITAQKATQAVESVFAARDSKRLIWSQINNVSNGGVFLDGPQPLYKQGMDGIVNTADDAAAGIETLDLPNQHIQLTAYTRQILIADVAGENGNLRKITV